MLVKKVCVSLLCGIAAVAAVGLPPHANAEVLQGDMSPQKIAFGNGGGGPTGVQVVGDFHIVHSDGFKGAGKRVAISVFNVAFRNEKAQAAQSSQTTKWGSYSAIGTAMINTLHQSKSVYQHTTITGIDQATRQHITDAAYADFVDQLTKAGYDVVSAGDLATLTPEYASWTAQPNFSAGRYGAYVAPTGRSLYFLRSDTAKGDTQGDLSRLGQSFQGFDAPQAFKRSPYLAHDGKIGVIAVTLVVDYGTYSNTGNTKNFNAKMKLGFTPGVTAQAGSFYDTATLIEYWGPNSGGFPAIAALAAPLVSDQAFSAIDNGGNGEGEVILNADPALFEKAAREVTHAVNARLVGVFATAAARQ